MSAQKIFNNFKTFFLAFLILLSLYAIRYTLYPSLTYAQSYAPLPSQINTQSPIYTNLQLLNLMHGLSCILTGNSPTRQPCVEYTIVKDLQGKASTIPVLSSVNTQGGLLGAAGSLLTGLYTNPPLNTSQYLASVTDGFGIVSSAHAQSVPGSGNNVLNPVITLWQVSRNFAYLVLIIVFIIVGLMVMFRTKINPQTVITIQAALPGLVVGLILITFSYFAAALITDAAFIGTDLVGYYFNAATGKEGSLLQQIQTENMVSIGSQFVGRLSGPNGDIQKVADIIIDNLQKPGDEGADRLINAQNIVRTSVAIMAYPVGSSVGKVIGGLIEPVIPAIRGWLVAKGIGKYAESGWSSYGGIREKSSILNNISGPLFGVIFASIAFAAPGFAIAWALYLIGIFAVLYAVFRLLLALINTYLSIIFATITAPFHFLAAALPGRQSIAINWARNMLADILAFPAVIAVFYFAAYLLGESKIQAFSLTTPLQITSTSGALPLFGGFDMSFVRVLLATGAILVTPKIPEIISQAIGKPSRAGGVFDQAITQAIGQGRQYSSQATQGVGKISGDVKEGWHKWKGQDPYQTTAEKVNVFRALQGKERLPDLLGPVVWNSQMREPEHIAREIMKSEESKRGGKNVGDREKIKEDHPEYFKDRPEADIEHWLKDVSAARSGQKATELPPKPTGTTD